MRKVLIIFILIMIVSLIGCENKTEAIDYSSMSITDQILELEIKRSLFNSFQCSYDDYANIHDWLFPENKQLKDEVVLRLRTGEIKGEELVGLSLEQIKSYIIEIDEEYENLFSQANKFSSQLVELSISDVYKDKTLDWYYVFTMKKVIYPDSNGESYIPTRFTLEKINEGYKIIEYSSDKRAGIVDEEMKDDILKILNFTTFYSEPVEYIKTIDTKSLFVVGGI